MVQRDRISESCLNFIQRLRLLTRYIEQEIAAIVSEDRQNVKCCDKMERLFQN